jgi:hypothetical protein
MGAAPAGQARACGLRHPLQRIDPRRHQRLTALLVDLGSLQRLLGSQASGHGALAIGLTVQQLLIGGGGHLPQLAQHPRRQHPGTAALQVGQHAGIIDHGRHAHEAHPANPCGHLDQSLADNLGAVLKQGHAGGGAGDGKLHDLDIIRGAPRLAAVSHGGYLQRSRSWRGR